MQIYKHWAIVVTLVTLTFDRKRAQEESFASVHCNLCFSCTRALLAVGGGVGIRELLQGNEAFSVSLPLHLKLHHLRSSTGMCEACLCRTGNIQVYTGLVSAAKEQKPLEPAFWDPAAANACEHEQLVFLQLCPGHSIVTALKVFKGTKTFLLSFLEGGSSVTNNNYTCFL